MLFRPCGMGQEMFKRKMVRSSDRTTFLPVGQVAEEWADDPTYSFHCVGLSICPSSVWCVHTWSQPSTPDPRPRGLGFRLPYYGIVLTSQEFEPYCRLGLRIKAERGE
jgi:hypothetical protein